MKGPLFVATGNQGKFKEIVPLLREYLKFQNEIHSHAVPPSVEDKETFSGNAEAKALALREILLKNSKIEFPFWVLADDSGLCVEALGGKPGVHSARYAGDHVDPKLHMEKLLQTLKGIPDNERTASYECVLYLLGQKTRHESQTFTGFGKCQGRIGHKARGEAGFGYDPIFIDPKSEKSFSELSYDEKNSFSHRRNAFADLAKKFFKHEKI